MPRIFAIVVCALWLIPAQFANANNEWDWTIDYYSLGTGLMHSDGDSGFHLQGSVGLEVLRDWRVQADLAYSTLDLGLSSNFSQMALAVSANTELDLNPITPSCRSYLGGSAGMARQRIPGFESQVDPVFEVLMGCEFNTMRIDHSWGAELKYRIAYHGLADDLRQSSFYTWILQFTYRFDVTPQDLSMPEERVRVPR